VGLIEQTFEVLIEPVAAAAASSSLTDEMGCNSSKGTGTVEVSSHPPASEHAEGHHEHGDEKHENAEHHDDDHGRGDGGD